MDDRIIMVSCVTNGESSDWVVSFNRPEAVGTSAEAFVLTRSGPGLPVDDLEPQDWLRDALVSLVEML